MKNIEIETFATWEAQTSIFGVKTTPLILQIDIKNKSSKSFNLDGICISVKNNFILFDISKDDLFVRKNEIISPNSKLTFKIDIRNIHSKYSGDKKFTIKVFGNKTSFESEKLSINFLHRLMSAYTI